MTRKYIRLTSEKKHLLSKMLKKGVSVKEAAEVLGVHRDTIYREFKRTGTDRSTYAARE